MIFVFTKVMEKQSIIAVADSSAETKGTLKDRYYRTLYECLLRMNLTKPAKLDDFFTLLFKSLKSDLNADRVCAFIRRLLQLSLMTDANVAAGILLIISELIYSRKDVKLMFFSQAIGLDDSDDEVSLIPNKKNTGYDSIHRDPRYTNAVASPVFELKLLS